MTGCHFISNSTHVCEWSVVSRSLLPLFGFLLFLLSSRHVITVISPSALAHSRSRSCLSVGASQVSLISPVSNAPKPSSPPPFTQRPIISFCRNDASPQPSNRQLAVLLSLPVIEPRSLPAEPLPTWPAPVLDALPHSSTTRPLQPISPTHHDHHSAVPDAL